MKVRELIELLKRGNPEADVWKTDGDGGEQKAGFVLWQTAEDDMSPREDAPREIATIAWIE